MVLRALVLSACTFTYGLGFSALSPGRAEPTQSTLNERTIDRAFTTPRMDSGLVGKVGLLKSRDGVPRCTAFCLSHDLIATAGHCLRAHPTDTRLTHTRLIFQQSIQGAQGASDRSVSGDAPTSKISSLISGGTQVSFSKPIEADRDWAILRLKTPACKRGGVTMASRSPSDRPTVQRIDLLAPRLVITSHGQATLTTHRCKRQHLTQRKNFTNVSSDFSDVQRLMFHNCDAGLIASGAPILSKTAMGFEVVAMHVGTYVRSRILEQERAVVARLTSKAIANIAVPAEEFIRPVRDLLEVRKPSQLSGRN